MMRHLLQAALVVTLALVSGCSGSPGNGGGTSAGGSLAASRDDALLYAADADRDALFVIDAKTSKVVAQVAVGRRPEKVLVGPDGTVFVTNRMSRSVSVLRAGDTTESARVAVGVEPVGLSLSRDGKTLYVVNSTSLTDATVGTVQAIDTRSLATKWETPVGAEPRGIALTDDGRAVVTLYKSGGLVQLDLGSGKVTKSVGNSLFEALNGSALGLSSSPSNGPGAKPMPNGGFNGFSTVRPLGLEAVLASPDGKQVYVPSLLATDARLDVRSESGTVDPTGTNTSGAGYGGGSCGATAAASPALLTLDDVLSPNVTDMTACTGGDEAANRPPMVLTAPTQGTPIQGATAIAMDPTGSFLYVANRESNNVAVIATAQRTAANTTTLGGRPMSTMAQLGTVTALVGVGAAPTGIAVAHDGTKAWVYNAFDHSLTTLEQRSSTDTELVARKAVVLADEVLPTDVAQGRRLFFSAVDPRMDSPLTGIACATCHLEGREDGHVWNFNDGPRQTPSLAGRALDQTAPYHWSGEFTDFNAFMQHTTQRRMGGTGATPEMAEQLRAFLFSLEAPDNPHRGAGTPAEVLSRGRAAFEMAACDSCHAGSALTDNRWADVGTLVRSGTITDDVSFLPTGKLNTPSLLGLARTAPYLHDGSVATLKERILRGQSEDRHGFTSRLSAAEVDDLVAYLKSL